MLGPQNERQIYQAIGDIVTTYRCHVPVISSYLADLFKSGGPLSGTYPNIKVADYMCYDYPDAPKILLMVLLFCVGWAKVMEKATQLFHEAANAQSTATNFAR